MSIQFDKEYAEKFMQLPKRLRDKILPPKKLTSEQRQKEKQENIKREASIFPLHLKTKHSASRHARRYDAQGAACEAPPYTNRGGKSEDSRLPSFAAQELLKVTATGHRGNFQTVLIPRPDKSRSVKHSFVDWVSFTFKKALLPLDLHAGQSVISDHDYVTQLSASLFDVFGYGVSGQRLNGLNFYEKSFDLGHNGWGFVCIGGQRDTVLVTVKGQGLLSAKVGWEQRLYDFLKTIPDSRLTRVDLANDDFCSEVSLDDYLSFYHAGLFASRGRPPEIEQAGNWIKPNGKGRTLYVGSRKSGKLLRIYEKGLQLANGFHEKFPNWVRVELELKSQDRVIPLDALLRPGQYLAGAYPALANLHKVQSVVKTAKNIVKSTFEQSLEVTRHQFGKHIWTHVQILGAEEAIRRLTDGKAELPAKLNFDTFDQFQDFQYLHQSGFFTQPHSMVNL